MDEKYEVHELDLLVFLSNFICMFRKNMLVCLLDLVIATA